MLEFYLVTDAQYWTGGRYPVSVSGEQRETQQTGAGLCSNCRFMRLIESDRGSTFYLCEKYATDARFPKYPRLPVLRCVGYEPSNEDRDRK